MTEGGEPVRRLTDYGFNPAWSPDGKEIVCTENNVEGTNRSRVLSRMWIINSSTGESRTLAVPDAVQASWSPDGRRVAYWAVDDAAQRDIWTVDVNGGAPVQVTADPFVDWGPVWSRDGEYLYFISNRKGAMSLWRVAIDQSSGKVRGEPESVPTPASETFHVSFSSNGRSLAFVGASRTQNIEKLGFDPAKEKIISGMPEVIGSSGEVTSPSISPDGQMLACQSVDAPRDIFALKLGGSILNQLTDDDSNDLSPVWSPDGRRIAYYTNQSGAYQIWMINPDGSGAQQITDASEPGGVVLPIWSPDSSRMAFSLFGGKTQIMDLRKRWTEQTPIDTAWIDPVQKSHFVATSWSPDGKYLAGSGYDGVQGRRLGLFAYSIEAQRYEMVSLFGLMPKWLVDNKSCVFVFEDRVFVTDIISRKPREIFSFAPDRITGLDISRDNRWIYISVDSTEADIWLLTLS
jgi:tricorn protease